MGEDQNARTPDGAFRLAILVIAVVAALALAAEVVTPLALAILLSFALAPIARYFERRGLPRIAATLLAVGLALGGLAGIGYVVGGQLITLANDLPRYQENIDRKIASLTPAGEGVLTRVSDFIGHVSETLEGPEARAGVPEVRVVESPTLLERFETALGPYIEVLGVGSIVLILILFLLLKREDMSDRIIRLFGHRRIGLTTRTMDEAGRRISRYLATFAAVNSGFGLIVGLGLWAIGVPYAALWGVLAGVLRFIPYVGTATAIALPLIFSVIFFASWREPILVLVLFGVLEVLLNSVLEPIIYGKTTGVSAVGLLVAAMFWTWLWGPSGLLLSTPLTVCLAVVGKYVPGLGLFATLLGEEPALEGDIRLYQRLLAVDRGGARAVVDEELKKRPLAEVFDVLLVPALARAELDHAREEINERDLKAVWRAFDDLLDELEWKSGITPRLLSLSGEAPGGPTPPDKAILGLAAVDTADALVLRMLGLLLAPYGQELQIALAPERPEDVADAVAASGPRLVVLSHLPPIGLAPARALATRLRERCADLPLIVGLWGEPPDTAEDLERLSTIADLRLAFTVAQARDQILALALKGDELPRLIAQALRDGDAGRADELFAPMLSARSPEEVFAGVVIPTLHLVESEPSADGPPGGSGHFAVEYFRRHLEPLINAVRDARPDAVRIVAACPQGDPHELHLTMLALTLRHRGRDVLYLGGSVAAARIPEVLDGFRPRLLILAASDPEAGQALAVAAAPESSRHGAPNLTLLGPAFASNTPGGSWRGSPVLPADPRAAADVVDRLASEEPLPRIGTKAERRATRRKSGRR